MSETELFQTDYNKTDCAIGIVHLGFGAFHRAHQAVFIDDYMQKTGDLCWGIAAVNLRIGGNRPDCFLWPIMGCNAHPPTAAIAAAR